MIRALTFCLGMVASTAFAATITESWKPVTQACDTEAENSFCYLKAGCPNWRWLTQCTAQNYYQMTPQVQHRLDWCMQVIDDNRTRLKTPALSGNPVAEAMNCLGEHH